jgi:hypothetical protein
MLWPLPVGVGQQAFDARCRAKLKKNLPQGHLAAIEALLNS